jgi:hypothetical protein
MRFILSPGRVLGPVFGLLLGLSLVWSTGANAAPVHHSRTRAHASFGSTPGRPAQDGAAPSAAGRIAVPGWSEEDTRRWLDGAGSLWRGA